MAIVTTRFGYDPATGDIIRPQGTHKILTKATSTGTVPTAPRAGDYVWNSTGSAITAGGTTFAANGVYRRVGNAWVQQ